jgi:hypothetical protein
VLGGVAFEAGRDPGKAEAAKNTAATTAIESLAPIRKPMNPSPTRTRVYTALFSVVANHLTLGDSKGGGTCGTISKVWRYRQRRRVGQ